MEAKWWVGLFEFFHRSPIAVVERGIDIKEVMCDMMMICYALIMMMKVQKRKSRVRIRSTTRNKKVVSTSGGWALERRHTG